MMTTAPAVIVTIIHFSSCSDSVEITVNISWYPQCQKLYQVETKIKDGNFRTPC